MKHLTELARSIESELHLMQKRYYTHHIPKSDTIQSGEIYIHEPVLMHLSPRKSTVKRGSSAGLYIYIKRKSSMYDVRLGFDIVHARFLAQYFSENLKNDVNGFNSLRDLVSSLESCYKEGKAWSCYSSNQKYHSCKKKKKRAEDEFKKNFEVKDLEALPSDYPIRNKANTGNGGGVAPYGGCYFCIMEYYQSYPRISDILSDAEDISRNLWEKYGFLHNMLFPSRFSKKRNTDQWRLLNRWFQNNKLDKRCEVCGCSSHTTDLEVHHIKPVCLGGKDEVSNMVALCRDHHDLCGYNDIGRIDEDGYLLQGNGKLKLLKSALKRIKGGE